MSFGNPSERVLQVPLLAVRKKGAAHPIISISAQAQPESDEYLMDTLKRQNQDALAEIFRRYGQLVFRVSLRILQDVGEAEDVVQEVFLYLYQKAEQFDPSRGEAKAWIIQIAYSRSLDRKRFLHRRHFYAGTNTADVADTLAGTDDVERHVVSKWNLARLEMALRELPDKQRRTLEMVFFEGFDLKETALRLDQSPENVRHYYYRGLQKLRKSSLVQILKDTPKE